MEKRHFLCMLFTLAAVVAVFVVIPMAILLWVDPLQVLYRHEGEQRSFFSDPLYRNAGLINRHLVHYKDKKAVVIGSSLFMDTLAVDMQRYAGMPDGLSLCISGLSPAELVAVYAALPAESPVEQVIIGLDPWKYFTDSKIPTNRLPTALYSGAFLDKLKAMARFEIVGMALRILSGSEPVRDHEEMLCSMHKACKAHNYQKFAQRYDELLAMSRKQAAALSVAQGEQLAVAGLDGILNRMLATPPQVRVHVLIAPVFFGGEFTAEFSYYHAGVMRLVRETAGRENIRIYGFDDLTAITHNIANYADTIHYGLGVNRYMLKAIGQGKHVLRPDTVAHYLERVLDKRTNTQAYYDPEQTVSFEGPVDEAAFSRYPGFPVGASPLPLPE